jgi:hypothetical protein
MFYTEPDAEDTGSESEIDQADFSDCDSENENDHIKADPDANPDYNKFWMVQKNQMKIMIKLL